MGPMGTIAIYKRGLNMGIPGAMIVPFRGLPDSAAFGLFGLFRVFGESICFANFL